MIPIDKWKEFCAMSNIKQCIIALSARADYQKRVEIFYAYGVWALDAPELPKWTVNPTIEEFLNWMAEGEPVFAKRLIVQNI